MRECVWERESLKNVHKLCKEVKYLRLYMWEFFWMIFPLGLHQKIQQKTPEHIIRFFLSLSHSFFNVTVCKRDCYDFSPPQPSTSAVSSSLKNKKRKRERENIVQKIKIDKFQWHGTYKLLFIMYIMALVL